jgi:thiamine-phosphate pyrophosphorylase
MEAKAMNNSASADLGQSPEKRRISGLYAVTPDEGDTARLVAMVVAVLEGGARWIQYRNKVAAPPLLGEQARALRAACARYGAGLIVNDHVGLAREINATGAHIGASDGDIGAARDALGRSRVLGVSCYASIGLARTAEKAGADYVAFGSVFTSPTKPLASRAPLSLFTQARAAGIGLPLVGIGGVTLHNVEELIDAQADAAAVIAALFADGDPQRIRERTVALVRCFGQT